MTATRPEPLVSPTPFDPGPAVVVGVDASVHNQGAVAWAEWEAAAEGRPLLLVLVLEPHPFPHLHETAATEERLARDRLADVVGGLRRRHPGTAIRQRLAAGRADLELARLCSHQAALVVGRQGRGSFVHMMVGATALGCAGRAPVPVVVVPDDWDARRHTGEPVALGIDHRDPQHSAIRFAFDEARRRGVLLVASHGRGAPGLDWGTAYVSACDDAAERESMAALDRVIAPYREEFPDVTLRVLHRMAHPLTVLLEEAAPCQLLVVGRHTSERSPAFPIGSVARGVLNYAQVPVTVVPPTLGRIAAS